jgi:hypothetical protein
MKQSNKADIERILKCRMNGHYKDCDLSVECKKFRKFLKNNSWYSKPDTHTARMMGSHTADIPKKQV